jgi:hypothetical protein
MPRLTLNKKIAITFFLIVIGVAFFFACLNFCKKTVFSPTQAISHYGSGEESFDNEVETEYNEEEFQEDYFFPKTYREIMEITHVHAFMIPLIIFVLARVLAMTGAGEGVKITVFTFAFIGTILNLSGPYLIRYKSDLFAISLLSSYIILAPCFITFIALPLYKMWSRKAFEETDYWL